MNNVVWTDLELVGWQIDHIKKEIDRIWSELETDGASVVDIFESHEWHSELCDNLRHMAKDAGVSLRFYDRADGSYRITLRKFRAHHKENFNEA